MRQALEQALAAMREARDQAIFGDSYGVPGSDFCGCWFCHMDSGAGTFAKKDWHDEGCAVRGLEAAIASAESALAAPAAEPVWRKEKDGR